MKWLWWKKGPNYEEELPRLAKEINNAQTKLIKTTSTHRRWRAIVLIFLLFVYSAILAYFFGFQNRVNKPYSDVWRYVHVFADPILAYLLYTTLTRTLIWRENRLRNRFTKLTAQRKELLEAYKKTINFEKIQKIIGEPLQDPTKSSDLKNQSNSKNKNVRKRVVSGAATPAEHLPQKNITAKPQIGGATPPISGPAGEKQDGLGKIRKSNEISSPKINEHWVKNSNFVPLPVYHTSWVDRVFDFVLGENEQGPTQRYALICKKCHAHNGLAPFGKSADEVIFVCPVCGTLNDPKSNEFKHSSKDTSEENITGEKKIDDKKPNPNKKEEKVLMTEVEK